MPLVIAVGRIAVGRIAVGRIAAGRIAVGRIAVGRIAVGRIAAGRSPLGINHWLHVRGGQRTGIYSKKVIGLLQGISARSVAVDLFLSDPYSKYISIVC
jgi:hypothetical protein